MALQNNSMMSFLSSHRSLRKLANRLSSGLLALSLSVGVAMPSFAADPFREGNPYQIGERTEEAFYAIFREGNYIEAERILQQAEQEEPGEPLVHAMLASMAYLKGEDHFEEVNRRAALTTQAAQAMLDNDPESLRGNLYSAVGVFLEGAYVLKTQGVAQGTPTALGMLQQVFSSLDKAEEIAPDDPELNLLKGYMDLMLAVNLPFSNPDEAITRMSEFGSPSYLAQRGIAIGYRDLEQYDKALIAVDTAISEADGNPELYYLKGQVLVRSGNPEASVPWFQQALENAEGRLPERLTMQIRFEECRAAERGNCGVLRP
ncbi:MAG: Sll0314/Alr1548 family TPR repeat-containing protein [Cyanobacteria bacterium P01_C01_bin.121]